MRWGAGLEGSMRQHSNNSIDLQPESYLTSAHGHAHLWRGGRYAVAGQAGGGANFAIVQCQPRRSHRHCG